MPEITKRRKRNNAFLHERTGEFIMKKGNQKKIQLLMKMDIIHPIGKQPRGKLK